MKSFNINRFSSLGILVTMIGLVIVLQMVRVQNSVSGKALRDQANLEYEYIRKKIQPERGNIYDRWGNLLAGNVEVYDVGVSLHQVKVAGNAAVVADVLSRLLHLDRNEVYDKITAPYKNEYDYVTLTDFVSPDKIAHLERLAENSADPENGDNAGELINLTGVYWSPHLHRSYPENSLGSNILGFYAFRDRMEGKAHLGVEEKYNDLLAGSAIEVEMPVDPSKVVDVPSIPPGASLILTIDREIQAAMENILDQAVESSGSESGTIVVMDPKTGELLAIAVTPRMDPNQYWEFKNQYFDQAIEYPYEPGSVFKVLTMAAALDSGAVTPETEFLDTGVFHYGGINVYNWDRGAWGPQDMTGCMQHSLNVCLSWIATQIGASQFYDYMQDFGMGHRTNVDLAGESVWPMSIPGDSNWYDSSLVVNSFGQGLAATPIQMISAISALANDGKMMAPHVLKAVIENGRQRNLTPLQISQPIKAETAHTITEMLARSLELEASNALIEGYRVAGKTGTGEIAGPDGYTTFLTNASFVGWGPVDDIRFIVYIWLEKPTSSPWGSIVAAPVFSEVVQNLVILMDIPPDDVRQQIYQK